MTNYDDLVKRLQNQILEMIVVEKQARELASSGQITQAWVDRTSTQHQQLKTTLNGLYEVKYNEAKSVTSSYKNVKGIQKKVEEDIANAESVLEGIKNEINSANRMTEIADYQLKKHYSYRDILKTVVYISILLIAVMFLITQPWFPQMFGKALIILILAYGLYLIIGKILDNFRREDKYWDKYKQFTPTTIDDKTGKVSLSKWEHNKRAIGKVIDSIGGSKEICKGVDSTSSNSAYDALDDDLAKGLTSGTISANQNANIGDL